MEIVADLTFAILFGVVLRFIIVVLFLITIGKIFKIKNKPSLPPVLGAMAIVYYFSLSEEYANLEYINGFVILGMFLFSFHQLVLNGDDKIYQSSSYL